MNGYLYAYLLNTTVEARIYRCSTSTDISNAGNWVQLTISGTALDTTLATAGMAGFANNNFYFVSGGTALNYYSLSELITAVCEKLYKILATFGSAPIIRFANLSGNLDLTKQLKASSGTYFALPNSFYASGSSTALMSRIPW